MSERIFGTEKVNNVIGLRDQIVYEYIDIYVDTSNNNNLWGIVHYTDYQNRKPNQKEEIIRFENHDAMVEYVKTHFNGYELDHPVDINHKRVFFHDVDYCDIKYFYYDGKPQLNHIEITYRENDNGNFVRKTVKFPKEYEDMFVEILKISKKIPPSKNLDSRYQKDVDVYEERANNRKEIIRSISMSFEEFFALSGKKIREIKEKKNFVSKLKVVTSVSAIVALLATGYTLESNNAKNSEYLSQKNAVRNSKDMKIYMKKGEIGLIIEKLMNDEYIDISPDEIKSVVSFIYNIEFRNYDFNDSFNSFNYSDYFKYKVGNSNTFIDSSNILTKIEKLYNNCFELNSEKYYSLNKDAVYKYINYVASLSFMYDTYHTDRPYSYVSVETQSITSPYATKEEIEMFDSYPPILRCIILTQLKCLLSKSKYEVIEKPSYYFKGTDKYDLLSEINKKLDSIVDEMFFKCGYSNSKNV